MFLDALRDGLTDVPPGSSVLVGVSGGADSVSLLHGLHELRDERWLNLHVAHLDHGLRPESTADAEWVAALAEELDVPVVVERVDVSERSRTWGVGLEEAGRRARYEFFERIATETDCPFVAVAHTADDQAETVLHHVLRGTGLDGLRGMPRCRPLGDSVTLIRPLLDVPRTEIEQFLSDSGESFLEDASNSSASFTRNRIRHELLPLIEREFNPNVRDALLRLSDQVGDTADFVRERAAELLSRAMIIEPALEAEEPNVERVRLDVSSLLGESDFLVRAAFVELWRAREWPRQRMGFTEWQRLVEVVRGGDAIQLPGGIDARRHRDHLVLTRPA